MATQSPAGHCSTPTPSGATAPVARTRDCRRTWAIKGAKHMSCGTDEAVVTIDRYGPVNGCQRETIRSSDRLLTCGSISNAFWPSGPCDGMRLRHSGWADSQQDVHGYLPGAILGGESVPRAVMMLITAKLPRKRRTCSDSDLLVSC